MIIFKLSVLVSLSSCALVRIYHPSILFYFWFLVFLSGQVDASVVLDIIQLLLQRGSWPTVEHTSFVPSRTLIGINSLPLGIFHDSVKFSFIYIVPTHNNSCLKVLWIVQQTPYNNTKNTEKNLSNHMTYEQALW